MPPEGGVRKPLALSYTWGQEGLEAQFAPVFQPGQGIFSPGYPLAPPEPERTRLWDFPVGVNTIYTPRAYEAISFDELRALADAHDITRLAIETRKDQIEKLDWAIKPRSTKLPIGDAATRAARLADFWRQPDGERPFATWLRELLEDVLVIDAPALELRRNRGGDIIALDVVDGATIKVLFDETGRRPRPPAPAFEQVIHGRPWKLLTSDDLLYLPRNPRPHKAYGFGPVEQIIMTVNIALRRQAMQLQHFTEGNVPPGLMNAPDGWNVEQIRQFQEWFDSVLAGNTGARSRLVWGPSGTKYQPFKEAPYKDEFDEWLARIVCYAFSLPPSAFTRQINRATAETAQESSLAEGLAPLQGWVKRLADQIIQDRMGHADLEFAWVDQRPADPAEQAKMLDLYVRGGIYTVNEARDILGFDPVPGGDQAMVYGTTGAVPLAAPAAAPVTAKRAAVAARFRKYDPDEPRVPAGNSDGGQWTMEDTGPTGTPTNPTRTPGDGFDGGRQRPSTAGAETDDVGEGKETTVPSASTSNVNVEPAAFRLPLQEPDIPTDVAYQGRYHDQVVAELAAHWRSQGAKVITSVALTARNGATARADLLAIDPRGGGLTLFEVKTGTDPQYTDPQRVVYPMAQVGNHVYSPDSKISQLGFAPREWLPPMRFYTIYKQAAQSPYRWRRHSDPLIP